MLNIKLMECGLDDTLKEMQSDLESVVGTKMSKRRKDEIIYKTLGSIAALWNLITITESEKTRVGINDSPEDDDWEFK